MKPTSETDPPPAHEQAAATAALRRAPAPATQCGVLVIDKPRGPTSHDVVARLRRVLGVRRIGHAGTLDPMASGVLVVLVGEATKLAAYLTAQDKRYEARIMLGVGTDTLDAEGEVTAAQPLPGWLDDELAALAAGGAAPAGQALVETAPRVAAALDAERARRAQMPPTYSAIKVAGRRSYAMARAGEAVDLSPRPVEVRSLVLVDVSHVSPASRPASPAPRAVADPGTAALDVAMEVSKGYYVRALARDLGAHLEVPAHLAALRRTASGAFTVDRAVSLDAGVEALRAALQPLEQAAAQSLPIARLTERGARRARLGQTLDADDFLDTPPGGAALWLDAGGRAVALGAPEPDQPAAHQEPARLDEAPEPAPPTLHFSVLRGFSGASVEPEDGTE